MVSLFSCTKSQGVSFVTVLDEIDMYIQAGNTTDALNCLEKLEKRASTVFDEIGIFKRYLILGEKVKAEKWICKSIKNHPAKNELHALYSHFLLEEGRIRDAFNESSILIDSKYASLYSEAALRLAKEEKLSAEEVFNPPKKKNKKYIVSDIDKERVFYDYRFIDIYNYCYNTTKNSMWLRNSASLLMGNGEFGLASELLPSEIKTVEDGYFWGTILFDSGRFSESLDALLSAQDKWAEDSYSIKSIALSADDFYILGDDKSSELLRENLLKIEISEDVMAYMEDVLPLIYINTAIYHRNQNDLVNEYDALYSLVQGYPLYEPGLACYAEFALETMRRPDEEVYYKVLRNAGLKTLEMEQMDLLPKVTMEDAFTRIDSALAQKKMPDLVVLREELFTQTQSELSYGEKIGRLWKLLEKNETSSAVYPPEVIRYALTNLVLYGKQDDAKELFSAYLRNEYNLSMNQVSELEMTKLSLWEYEACAWFLKDDDVNSAKKIYEFIVRRYSDRFPGIMTQGQNAGVVNALVNLSVINGGYGDIQSSLENLNIASGKCTEAKLKAEILYRMAEIYAGKGDSKSAVRSLKYAISLNPNHNKARLLLKTVGAN